MTATMASASAPVAPGRLGTPLVTLEALRYLEALGAWRDQRKAELDLLDEAALQAPDQSAFTGDLMLSMALWKSVSDRYDLLTATWDSGRAGPNELERLATLVWSRVDTSLAVSLPEACRLSDALATSLRARLGIDTSQADVTTRMRHLRAAVERLRDLVDGESSSTGATGSATLARLTERVDDLGARFQRGADVGGLLGPLENDAARAERDLIVAASRRAADSRDAARAQSLRTELEAQGAALRDLAAQCVREVLSPPRLAVPDVSTLGPVPTDPVAVDAYLVRLDKVRRAMTVAQDAYAAALSERAELRGRLGAYAAKAAALAASPPGASSPGASVGAGRGGDLEELETRAMEVLDRTPVDLARARSLVAAYQAYLGSAQSAPPQTSRTSPGAAS
ncbi:MAG: hypothetical protein ABIO48_03430 [Pedococcus sp.]